MGSILFWLAFILVTILYTLVFHRVFKHVVLVSLSAAAALTVTFQIIDIIQLGHLDSFWMIAVVLNFVYSVILSTVTVYCFRYFIRRKKKVAA